MTLSIQRLYEGREEPNVSGCRVLFQNVTVTSEDKEDGDEMRITDLAASPDPRARPNSCGRYVQGALCLGTVRGKVQGRGRDANFAKPFRMFHGYVCCLSTLPFRIWNSKSPARGALSLRGLPDDLITRRLTVDWTSAMLLYRSKGNVNVDR